MRSDEYRNAMNSLLNANLRESGRSTMTAADVFKTIEGMFGKDVARKLSDAYNHNKKVKVVAIEDGDVDYIRLDTIEEKVDAIVDKILLNQEDISELSVTFDSEDGIQERITLTGDGDVYSSRVRTKWHR